MNTGNPFNPRVVRRPVNVNGDNLGSVNLNIAYLWTYTHTTGSVKIDSRLTTPDISSYMYILISPNDNMYTEPQYGDRVIRLTGKNTTNTAVVDLTPGEYFIKAVYAKPQNASFIFKFFII